MTVSRQDAWSQDEDLILAEIVLRHIREGSTQLRAFDEVGGKLSRTSAACGFRWNSHVRKQYESGIELAKKQRKESKKTAIQTNGAPVQEAKPVLGFEVLGGSGEAKKEIELDDVILYLKGLKKELAEGGQETMEQVVSRLREENENLQEELEATKQRLQTVEEDYHALIEIMDKARKMVIVEENKKVKFQMDQNGNLERVNK
ncbi:MAG: RsfA family transcriptional regulator [Bacillus sp. (in: firmicutes)]